MPTELPLEGFYTDGDFIYEVSSNWVIGMTKDGANCPFDPFFASKSWTKLTRGES
jgi:hypothetical protein